GPVQVFGHAPAGGFRGGQAERGVRGDPVGRQRGGVQRDRPEYVLRAVGQLAGDVEVHHQRRVGPAGRQYAEVAVQATTTGCRGDLAVQRPVDVGVHLV